MEGKKGTKSIDIEKYVMFMEILKNYKMVNKNPELFRNLWACDGCYIVHNLKEKRIMYNEQYFCEECSNDKDLDKSGLFEQPDKCKLFHCQECNGIYSAVRNGNDKEICYFEPYGSHTVYVCKSCKPKLEIIKLKQLLRIQNDNIDFNVKEYNKNIDRAHEQWFTSRIKESRETISRLEKELNELTKLNEPKEETQKND